MCFLNEEDTSLLLLGSTDSVVRIYRNYAGASTAYNSNTDETQLVTSWRALHSMLGSGHVTSPFVTRWLKFEGQLVTAGGSRSIKLYDVTTEQVVSVSTKRQQLHVV